ncbi:fatty acid synthase Fas [Mycobacterium tuberculosis]|nr:fatty acid synthase Fas [Mycobacterium tuberculosis]
MTIHEHDRVSADRGGDSPHTTHALVDRLMAGEPYAVAFGGQGSAWLETLEELVSATGIETELATLVGEAELLLDPVTDELIVVRPIGFEPLQWVRALAAEDPVPSDKHLTSAAVSVPGVLLTQIAATRALARQGMDLVATPPVAMAGHSQGVLAVEALKAGGARDVELFALAQLIGAAGTLVARRRGISVLGDRPPMVSVTNADPERIGRLLDEFAQDVRTVLPPVLSIRNGRRAVVITGTPEQLSRFELYCRQISEKEEADRKNKVRGGDVFSPVFEPVQVEVGFHTPRLSDGIDIVAGWAEKAGLDVALARELADAILIRKVDWVDEITRVHAAGARWILDLGPGDILTRLTAPVIRGLGIGIVPAATRGGQRNLFTVGATPEVARAWSSYAPTVVRLPDGRVKLSTKFTRLTGRSPILLAGMTPTTVDAKIVAAAANAGHWAELAGGGQVTEEIFGNRIEQMAGLLEPGRTYQFNALFLDPYLWKLQVGGKRLVQKARQSGAAIDGVVISAGIPDLDEAVELIDELGDIGISHVVFKPGTIEQIRSVIRIATEVPTKPVIMHVEGGRAGGHHSWEDLDDLLLATYSELRSRANITVCVGGGIGTPRRAAEYLSGRWAQAYGFPLMPIDGILVGTAAMATKESTTSPSVKRMLVDTQGTDQWISAGKAQGGMASSRSQLGADIHEIDNSASRCGRLLDEVAGDAEAVAERRDEIIAAMAKTAKPYFGDVADMTYLQWLRRYVELAIGEGNSTADTASVGSPWLADTWRDRFEQMLQRAEARLHPQDFGPIQTLFTDAGLLDNPQQAIAALLARYPDAETVQLHPADVPFFVTLCKTLGKPVNFVPVIDQDVRRWWRSDSLWQAHDARYDADAVCIIPGTASVAGITRMDEPVGELLDRFEQAAIDEVLGAGVEPKDVASRRLGRADVAGPLAVVLDAPDVRWAGRTVTNPVHRIADPAEWQVHDGPENPRATHSSTGARLQTHGDDVALSVPVSGTWVDIRFTLPANTVDGGTPVIATEDATDGQARPPARLVGWTARFLGMVRPGDEVDFRVERVGIDQGAEIVDVAARVGSDLVMSASARLAAPKTVYAFPGQGIQHKGMGMEVRARSKAARKVWDTADKFTRDTLGFSVLHVVRDNPTSIIASGVHYHHPDGVLYLTQFTQVAMATVAAAQVAEMREQGAFVEGAIACGHSVGEYTALACVTGIYQLEALLEMVFHRGSKMHDIVPRDELGRSNYRLAAIRPSQIDLDDADVPAFVAGIAESTGEFLEIVNFNLRGSQYAIAGTVRGLEALEAEVERRRELTGGRRSFILVPGIDVPFHSRVLRVGVAEFRRSLDRVMPRDADPDLIIGRYIPNLVPRLFTLDRDFIQEIRDLVPAEPLDEILADYDTWLRERPREMARTVFIELLAWQFASPVRWIETQDLLFIEEAAGGLGVERFVEIGVKSSPTVAGLATNTLKLPEYAHSTVEVLNAERDAAVLFATDTDPEPEPEEDEPVAESPAPDVVSEAAPVAPAASSAGPRPDDLVFDAADATLALIALSAKMRIDQIEELDSIESITDGASSRRNQLLVDLGSELNLGAIDGAAESDLAGLRSQVTKLARTYKPYGPVLSDAINDQLRTVLGPSGKRPGAIAERVKKTWELGEGWAKHVTVEVALGTREGSSVRGGAMGHLHEGALADAASVDKVIDAAVASVAARQGVSVALPSAGSGGGATIDAAALSEFTDQITGREGVLASAARLVLGQLGLDDPVNALPAAPDSELIDLVTAELGADWPRLVAPVFDPKKAVVFDDRWASAREDLVKLWLTDEGDIDADWPRLAERFEGAGHVVATQATWWQGKSLAAGRQIHASLYGRIAAGAENPEPGRYGGEVAVVTGASKGSIAASVVARLLDGGATVIATTSKLDEERLAFYRTLYRDHARYGAALWLVAANMASYSDVDALVEWIGTEQTESLGPQSIHIKDAQTPTLLFPFAAPRVVGDLSEAGSRAEMEMKVLLWAVQRLIGGLSTIGAERDIASRLHVVLPGSPNRGMFGGDGAYGEAKSALDAVVSRWHAESSWAARVSLAHALIGWTRGTGLMGHNDAIVAAVEEAGVTTYSTDEMAALLLDLCDAESKVAAARSPIKADLTGGLAEANLDMAELAAKAREQMSAAAAVDEDDLDVDPADLVVIVGGAEIGPYGSSRTRFEMEVENELSAAGVLELAWTTGLIRWEDDPQPGWYDTESGEMVDESELVQRYHDAVVQRVGIREFVDDGAIDPDHASPLLVSVFLEKDFAFVVSSEADARAFVEFDPEHTVIRPVPDSTDWQVIRKAGTEIRVPRKTKLSRVVGGQIPTGFDPTVWGISADMAGSIDRLAVWNMVATVDAFLSSGFSPAEVMRYVHPSLVANTQGTGMGGGTSMQTMYHGNLLGRNKPNDIFQEVLPNIIAAHVVQSYVGSYGAMIHPVAACATAAVSVEEGVDKIRLGKAQLVVAGGLDDLTLEGIIGFGDMAATADTSMMCGRGIHDSKFSRPNDRRRLGFVEAQGGGTILLARGDLALRMGLPVLAVVAFAQSFGDGVHTSIPAPGLGALGAGRGGKDSPLARALAKLGVAADDVAVISKHDTSTLANDPNETELHERLADALGRSEGAPLFVVSQKSLTGHAKGGAAVFQMMGLCQILRDGVIPPNRSLDCVDDELAGSAHFVWVRDTLRLGGKFPLKAGMLTSLGFGHVSGLVALVHPQAFIASLDPAQRADYQRRADARLLAGQRRLASAIAGGAPMYQRPGDRRFDHHAPERPQEASMLLNPAARLGDGEAYIG